MKAINFHIVHSQVRLFLILLLVASAFAFPACTEEPEAPAFKNAVYLGAPFTTPDPDASEIDTIISTANTLAASDFNTLLLSFLHVDSTDQLTFGPSSRLTGTTDSLLVYDQLPAIFANIKNARESVDSSGIIVPGKAYAGAPKKIILFSMGGWARARDMLRTYSPTDGDVYEQIKTVLDTYHIDGIDLDYEPESSYQVSTLQVWQQQSEDHKKGIDTSGFAELPAHQMLATLAQNLRIKAGATYITAAPYTEMDWWGSVGANNFDWWNVQFYGGTSSLCPNDWVSNFSSWQSASGRSDSFIVPGINADTLTYNCMRTRDSLSMGLQHLQQANIQAGGAFIWNYKHILYHDPAAWAEVIASHSTAEL